MRRITATLAAPVVVAALALAAGCGGGAAGGDDPAASPATGTPATESPASVPTADATTGATPPGAGPATVARAAADLTVHDDPDAEAPVSVLPALTEFGSPRVLLVVEDAGEWLRVALPERPNGSTGWVRRDAVELRTVDEAIVVDTRARTLTLFDAGVPVLTTAVAVGSPDDPTPTGSFFVVDKLDTGDPSGPYGRFAFGLSAHSDTLTEFAGGDGQVGIHGTDDPSSIGQAVSHGCVRVPADVAELLAATVNLGTPVVVS